MTTDEHDELALSKQARTVFVQDFTTVDRPFHVTAERVEAERERVFERAIASARAEGERLRTCIGTDLWPASLGQSVEVTPGLARRSTDGLLVAFRWRPVGVGGPFPRLDADLEVAPFGPLLTALSVRGRYRPTAVLAGRPDELLLHRITESTVRAFLGGLCVALADGERCGDQRWDGAGAAEPGPSAPSGGASTAGGVSASGGPSTTGRSLGHGGVQPTGQFWAAAGWGLVDAPSPPIG